MREFINVAYARGIYDEKQIRSVSDPWKITVRRKDHGTCEWVREIFCANNICDPECYVYYNGVEQISWNHAAFLVVGYGVCVKYTDGNSRKRTITNRGNVLFFKREEDNGYSVHLPNPPCLKIREDKVRVEFPVIAVFH